jgi:hypothetical protein
VTQFAFASKVIRQMISTEKKTGLDSAQEEGGVSIMVG